VSSLRLGRIAGIEFGVNWSWLVVFALIVWTLASAIFPSTNPGLSKSAHIAMAIVAAFLFFLSILAHEFGHALQARREGIEIEGITLWLFGGVAKFKGSYRSAGAEFRVAIAGPLVSLALGLLFVLIAVIPGIPSAADGVSAWLGYINLTLLAFNLIPAPPLDGGRVLHAALWRSRGDYVWATRIAANIGRAYPRNANAPATSSARRVGRNRHVAVRCQLLGDQPLLEHPPDFVELGDSCSGHHGQDLTPTCRSERVGRSGVRFARCTCGVLRSSRAGGGW
jgi:Zn-dependent protease